MIHISNRSAMIALIIWGVIFLAGCYFLWKLGSRRQRKQEWWDMPMHHSARIISGYRGIAEAMWLLSQAGHSWRRWSGWNLNWIAADEPNWDWPDRPAPTPKPPFNWRVH